MGNQLLKDKVALITGTSSGIGREIALTFSRNGAKVVANGRNRERLAELKEIIESEGNEILISDGDITSFETAKLNIETTMKKFGRVDLLVNNAGINKRLSTIDTSIDDWNKVLDVNLNGAFYHTKSVLPYMINQGYGKIINISSRASKSPHKNAIPAYGASKAALNYLTKHIALEYADKNIIVNGICPGPIETEMTEQWDEEFRKYMLNNIPVKRLGTTREVANLALFLASNQSDFITGETININGGVLMD